MYTSYDVNSNEQFSITKLEVFRKFDTRTCADITQLVFRKFSPYITDLGISGLKNLLDTINVRITLWKIQHDVPLHRPVRKILNSRPFRQGLGEQTVHIYIYGIVWTY